MRSPKPSCVLALLIPLLTASLAPAQSGMYTFDHLGFSGVGYYLGMNRWGDVVGANNQTGGSFLFSRGVLSTLYPAPSIATAINDNLETTLFINTHAYSYFPGASQPTALGTLGGFESYPAALNNSGTIVGQSVASDGQYHPFSFSNSQMTDLGTLGGTAPQCSATSVNSSGNLVGYCVNAGGYYRAFRAAPGGQAGDMDPRTTTYDSIAYGVNDAGDAAGYSDETFCNLRTGSCRGSTKFAVIFHSQGTITSIGGLGGTQATALGINNLGDVVGYSNGSAGWHAFLFTHGVMTDLNSATLVNGAGWIIRDAVAINDAGQIVGHATNPATQQSEIVLLTPVPVILTSLTLSPSLVAGGMSVTGTVTLSRPAPIGGVVISLSANNPAVQLPSSVTVPANASSATFTITTSVVFKQTTVSISASFNGVTRTVFLTLSPDHGS